MKQEIMYKGLAKYYDLIYNWKDYKKEAGKIKKLISKYKKSGGNDLLEAGCGTGRHLKFFEDKFFCMGMDINKEMLDAANKNVRYFADRHQLGLFEVKKTLSIMEENSLKAVFLKNGLMKDRGLYIAV